VASTVPGRFGGGGSTATLKAVEEGCDGEEGGICP
jgi:hypothetical protein